MISKKDLDKRVRSLENFRWRLRNAFGVLRERDDSETSLEYVPENELDLVSSKSDSDTDEMQSQMIEVHDNMASAHFVVEIATSFVWPLLRDWISRRNEDGNRRFRFSKFLRLIDPRNLIQALSEREEKAQQKYGSGLSIQEGDLGIQQAIDKLSDSVFFLFKAINNTNELARHNRNEFNRQLNIITDLHSTLGAFISEIKSAKLK